MRQKHGYIRLDRNILKWRWYGNANTMRVFLHLLLNANWEDSDVEGETIHRGEVLTSVDSIKKALKLSEKNVRTALEHLISTNEVAKRSTPNYSVISIVNYELYQSDRQTERQTGGKRPATSNTYIKQNKKDIYINPPKKTRLVLREDPVTFATWFEEVPDDDE